MLANTKVGFRPEVVVILEIKETVLAAVGQSEVLGSDFPPEFRSEKFDQRLDEELGPLRSIVVSDHPLEFSRLGENGFHALAEPGLDGRDVTGVATTEHEGSRISDQGIAQVIHQFPDADLTGEAFSKIRVFHGHRHSG